LAGERRRGLLIDFGGVLTTSVFGAFEAFCDIEGLPPDTVRRAFRENEAAQKLLFDLELGAIEQAAFDAELAMLIGVAPEGLAGRMFAALRPDEAMFELVRDIRGRGIRTGLISNSWGTALYDRETLGELFDAIVISGEERIRKPDPAIYVLGAERIGLPPSECVFVDDLPFNLKPARELGMATVHHTSATETARALDDLLAGR
jgi:epoxide hydrolase-like predicted phosphatase